MTERFLITGREMMARMPNFQLRGRTKELAELSSLLLRKNGNSVLLHGPGGVGCSALVYGLQASKADPATPFDIISKSMLWLDTDLLFGLGDQRTISDTFNSVMAEIRRTIDSILVIRDTKDFIDGCRNTGNAHFINILASAIQAKDTQAIFEARDEELDFILKSHSDLGEVMTRMDLAEPTGAELSDIVADIAISLSQYHGILCDPDAAVAAIELTTKYRPNDPGLNRAQPERTATLLDRSFTKYRLDSHGTIEGVTEQRAKLQGFYRLQREAEQKIGDLHRELESQRAKEAETNKTGVTEHNDSADLALFNRAMDNSYESPEVKAIREKIGIQQRQVSDNRAAYQALTAELNKGLLLTREIVTNAFSEISGIATSRLKEDERQKLINLDQALKSRIFGQDEGLNSIATSIRIFKFGKRKLRRPVCFFILGPSGVGKTETCKVLAEHIYDDAGALHRYDMGEYMEKHSVARLIGAPPGYEGFDIGGTLTEAGRKRPRAVFLFDEFEKAHVDLQNVFLAFIDEGNLTDGIGRKANFEESIGIFTSNVGQEYFLDTTLSWEEACDKALADLSKAFRPEFLNRFEGRENIICFHRLGLDSMEKIVKRELRQINDAYAGDGIDTIMSDADIAQFCIKRYSPRTGARGIPAVIKKNVEGFIVDQQIANGDVRGTVRIGYADEHLTANFEEPNEQRSAA